MSGLFITFEGIDGSGKSTQLNRCADALKEQGHEVIITRNPGGTDLGQGIRQILLHHPGFVSDRCELMLYVADRVQHMEEVVLPALKEGKIVLCDRHMDSTIAYQGYGRKLNLDEIEKLHDIALEGKKPDLTLLFDGEPEALLARVKKRGEADRLESEALEFYQKVRDGYLTIAKQEPGRVKVLEAIGEVDSIFQNMMNIVDGAIATSK